MSLDAAPDKRQEAENEWMLDRHGLIKLEHRGSHVVIQRVLPKRSVTIPVPTSLQLRADKLLRLIHQAGIKRS